MFTSNAPGSYFQYSNVNFVTLGTIIESVSNQRFDLFFKTRLFDPLNISGGFNLYKIQDYNNLATLYRNDIVQQDDYISEQPSAPDFDTYVIGSSAQFFGPQGSLRVSAEELSRILQVLMNQGMHEQTQIISPESVESMLQSNWTYNGTNGNNYYGLFQQWGLGVHKTTNQIGEDVIFPDYPLTGHAGEAYGLISDMYMSQEFPFGLVWMTNGYHPNYAYAFANNSSFYQVESDIYKILEEQVFESCKTTNIQTIKRSPQITYVQNDSNLLVTTDILFDHYSVIDINGKKLHQEKVESLEFSISANNLPNVIILIFEQKEQQWSKKIMLNLKH